MADVAREGTLIAAVAHAPTLGATVAAVDDAASLAESARRLGYPCVLKTRRLGYDGKGQFVIRDAGQLDAAWAVQQINGGEAHALGITGAGIRIGIILT